MLPDEMFVNLIDMDLQNRIAIANDLDSDAVKTREGRSCGVSTEVT